MSFGFGLGLANEGRRLDPAASAFFARLTTPPTTTRAAAYNSLFTGLRTTGILPLLDALYILAAADSQAAGQNLVQNAYNLTPVNSPPFVADQGQASNGTNAYLNTGFSPGSAPSPKYTQNSAHVSAYNRTARGAAAQQIMGASDGAASMVQLASTQGAGQALLRINDSGGGLANVVSNQGLWHANRTSSTAATLYRNGASFGSNTVNSTAVVNLPIWILGVNVSNSLVSPTTDQIAMASIGAGMTATQAAQFYNLIQAYMTAVGANV